MFFLIKFVNINLLEGRKEIIIKAFSINRWVKNVNDARKVTRYVRSFGSGLATSYKNGIVTIISHYTIYCFLHCLELVRCYWDYMYSTSMSPSSALSPSIISSSHTSLASSSWLFPFCWACSMHTSPSLSSTSSDDNDKESNDWPEHSLEVLEGKVTLLHNWIYTTISFI